MCEFFFPIVYRSVVPILMRLAYTTLYLELVLSDEHDNHSSFCSVWTSFMNRWFVSSSFPVLRTLVAWNVYSKFSKYIGLTYCKAKDLPQ